MSAPKLSPLDDEWWTTAMVCAYLKLGKRALWDIRCNPSKGFPMALKPGGKVNLFRALDVRAWLENRSAFERPADFLIGARSQLLRDQILGASAHPFLDV